MMNRVKKMTCIIASSILNLVLNSFLSEANEFRTEDVNEYCHTETFRPRCQKSEVVLMTSAIYGRMRIGKCITTEEHDAQRLSTRDESLILGCSADIRTLLDKKCSGNSECDIRVFDIENDAVKPCVPGLKVYLEASFDCIRVADERRSCSVTVSSEANHIIFDPNVPQNLCGTKAKPWIIEAPTGQRISITILNFNPSASDNREIRECLQKGMIVEKSAQVATPICTIHKEREKLLYMSKRNSLEITFIEEEGKQSIDEKLILRLKAVGCSDLVPPEDMWLRRNEDWITIGCYNNRLMWRLNCTQGKWTGVIGNCTKEISKTGFVVSSKEEKDSLSENEQVLAIVAICGFTVAICIAIVCVGAVCLRRFYLLSKRNPDYKTLSHFVDPTKINCDTTQRFLTDIRDKEQRLSEGRNAPTYSVWMDGGEANRNSSQGDSQ